VASVNARRLTPGGTATMDADLKRDARSVIDRIVQLRDSL
jgi:hypothetical protein